MVDRHLSREQGILFVLLGIASGNRRLCDVLCVKWPNRLDKSAPIVKNRVAPPRVNEKNLGEENVLQYPQLPPIYSLKPLEPGQDPFETATASAAGGEGEAGDFFWSQRLDHLEVALVLEPESSLAESLTMLPLAMVAFGDALGAVAPPVVAVHFRWPDRVEVNGGFVGGFRVASAEVAGEAEVPDWLVIGFSIAVQMDLSDEAPGRRINETTLYDEGCGEVTVDDLTESFGRHFLAWINRWQDEGFEPVRLAWLARLKQEKDSSGAVIGPKRDLDSLGGLFGEGIENQSLLLALKGPSWASI